MIRLLRFIASIGNALSRWAYARELAIRRRRALPLGTRVRLTPRLAAPEYDGVWFVNLYLKIRDEYLLGRRHVTGADIYDEEETGGLIYANSDLLEVVP